MSPNIKLGIPGMPDFNFMPFFWFCGWSVWFVYKCHIWQFQLIKIKNELVKQWIWFGFWSAKSSVFNPEIVGNLFGDGQYRFSSRTHWATAQDPMIRGAPELFIHFQQKTINKTSIQ